jgi:hypothetical protein
MRGPRYPAGERAKLLPRWGFLGGLPLWPWVGEERPPGSVDIAVPEGWTPWFLCKKDQPPRSP